jgi:hypothetical protein
MRRGYQGVIGNRNPYLRYAFSGACRALGRRIRKIVSHKLSILGWRKASVSLTPLRLPFRVSLHLYVRRAPASPARRGKFDFAPGVNYAEKPAIIKGVSSFESFRDLIRSSAPSSPQFSFAAYPS